MHSTGQTGDREAYKGRFSLTPTWWYMTDWLAPTNSYPLPASRNNDCCTYIYCLYATTKMQSWWSSPNRKFFQLALLLTGERNNTFSLIRDGFPWWKDRGDICPSYVCGATATHYLRTQLNNLSTVRSHFCLISWLMFYLDHRIVKMYHYKSYSESWKSSLK